MAGPWAKTPAQLLQYALYLTQISEDLFPGGSCAPPRCHAPQTRSSSCAPTPPEGPQRPCGALAVRANAAAHRFPAAALQQLRRLQRAHAVRAVQNHGLVADPPVRLGVFCPEVLR